jgi:hypothetical protein
MSKRIFSLVAIGLIASMVFTAVVHACSDLSSMHAVLEAPCDHNSSQDEPGSKSEKDNCDSVRYGMLSTGASFPQMELFNLNSILLHDVVFESFSLSALLPMFWRSQGPPFAGLDISSRLSHVVLRI